jgi:hypothetical protein
VRRFTNDDDPRLGEDRSGGVKHHRGCAEAAGNDRLDRPIEEIGQFPGIGGDHADPPIEAETADEAAQVIGSRRPPIDEEKSEVGAVPGDHETGDAAPAAEVDNGSGHAGQGVDKRRAVLDDVGDRRRADHAMSLRGGERLDQRLVS